MVPAKTGVRQCTQCSFACQNEEYRLSHRFVDGKEDASLLFCSRECMMEYFEDELFFSKIEAAIGKEREDFEKEKEESLARQREEHARFLKQVCPACIRRLRKILERQVG